MNKRGNSIDSEDCNFIHQLYFYYVANHFFLPTMTLVRIFLTDQWPSLWS